MGFIFADAMRENTLRSGLKLHLILQKKREVDMAAWQSSISHSY